MLLNVDHPPYIEIRDADRSGAISDLLAGRLEATLFIFGGGEHMHENDVYTKNPQRAKNKITLFPDAL